MAPHELLLVAVLLLVLLVLLHGGALPANGHRVACTVRQGLAAARLLFIPEVTGGHSGGGGLQAGP